MRSSENLLCPWKALLALLVCSGLAAHGPAQDTCLTGEAHSVTLVGSSESDEVVLAAPADAVSRLVGTLRNETDGSSLSGNRKVAKLPCSFLVVAQGGL
jgi:hypothetical protein